MKGIKIEVTGNIARVTEKPARITAGTVGLPVEFSFDEPWEGLDKTAVFQAGRVCKIVENLNAETVVPWEVLVKNGLWLSIGVYGTNKDGSCAIPTTWANVSVIAVSAHPNGDPSTDPTLPVWQKLLNAVGNLLGLKTRAKNNLVDAINEVHNIAIAGGVETDPTLSMPGLAADAAVTGEALGSKPGRKTADGGEIFNDYENNEALGDFTKAEGKNSKSGICGYKVLRALHTNNEKNQFYIDVQGREAASSYAEGDLLCFDGKTHVYDKLVITGLVQTDNPDYSTYNETRIYVDSVDGTSIEGIQEENSKDPWENWVYCLAKPNPEGGIPVQSSEGAYAGGVNARAVGRAAFARGRDVKAIGDYAYAVGRGTKAAYAAYAEGKDTIAEGYNSHAEGSTTSALGAASHAEGQYSQANSRYSHSEGYNTRANAESAHAEGNGSIASGVAAHAEGYLTEATAEGAHAEGYKAVASGMHSHAEGTSKATGVRAHAEGSGCKADGDNSHAEGSGTTASGSGAHTEGLFTTASGKSAHAEGSATKASGHYSHAEGDTNEASGHHSHVEGYKNTSTGQFSHAEGSNVEVRATGAHGEGLYNVVEEAAKYAHVQGYHNKATAESQHVMGKYNEPDNTKAVILGNGTSDADRSNAFTVDWAGNTWFAGGVTASSEFTVSSDAEILTHLDNLVKAMPNMGVRTVVFAVQQDASGHMDAIFGGGSTFANIHKITTDYAFAEAKRYGVFGVEKWVRQKYGGTWKPWEWENPPMELGMEYRTTERHNGRAVYAKCVAFGGLPHGTTKISSHGIGDFRQLVKLEISSAENESGSVATGKAFMVHDDIVRVGVDSTNITLVTSETGSGGGIPVNVTLWYTKVDSHSG